MRKKYDYFVNGEKLSRKEFIIEKELDRIRDDVSILIGELKRYGCRRKER